MHITVQIISPNGLSYEEISQMLAPYEQTPENFAYYAKHKIDRLIEWDYWDLKDKRKDLVLGNCFAIFDPDKQLFVREKYSTALKKWVPCTNAFEKYIEDHRDEWKDYVIQEIDMHW